LGGAIQRNIMTYYTNKTSENCISTAIYPNRIKEKEFIEKYVGLSEFGNYNTLFKTKFGTIVAQGYLRIVYGDHGAYVEFLRENIKWEEFECERKNFGYYDKYYSIDGSEILLYYQLRNVKNLPNPPKPGFIGNRVEGYADYRVGRIYISVYDLEWS
jgi:hypothetical protein